MTIKEAQAIRIPSPVGELTVLKRNQYYLDMIRDALPSKLRLPTSSELEKIVTDESTRAQLANFLWNGNGWIRSCSIVAYLASGKEFRKGYNIYDSFPNQEGVKLTLPYQMIPEAAIGNTGGLIFIEHPQIIISGPFAFVTSISPPVFLPNAAPLDNSEGIIDPITGLVLIGTGDKAHTRKLTKSDKEDKVSPVLRYFYADLVSCVDVCDYQPYASPAVLVESHDSQTGIKTGNLTFRQFAEAARR